MPLIALAIWLEDRGPVLFAQHRAGLHGVPFRLLKFRTMHVGADRSLEDLLDELPEPMFKLRRDPRVTRVGRFLRRLSLDELPQLWNLLRGDMSLVGPRPEQLELVERYGPEHRFRLEVKPGLTGPMQVHGRGELTFEERLAVELDYVENLSIGRDLRILALTPVSVIRAPGRSSALGDPQLRRREHQVPEAVAPPPGNPRFPSSTASVPSARWGPAWRTARQHDGQVAPSPAT